MPRHLPATLGVPRAALDELLAAYDALGCEVARLGVVCQACGKCCDFARNDYRLYASRLELALVLRDHGPPRLRADGCCGFLRNGRCSIHPSRPLGCRTFFCDPAHRPREQDLCHAFQRQLRTIAERHTVPWGYAPFFEER